MRNNTFICLALVVIICLFQPAFVSAETIILKSGQRIEGKIIEKTDKYLKVETLGVTLTYYPEDIKSIEEREAREVPESTTSLISLQQEKSPAQIFEEVSPAIVVINVQLPKGAVYGSGFIVDKSGIIVTNFHVVAGAEEIEVKLKNGKKYPVTDIIDYDPIRDVCVLKIDASGLSTVLLGDSDKLAPGQKILVIGAPLGLEYSITDGLFSGGRFEFNQKSLQFSAPISPGNSGGPLLDIHGQVIGITTYIKLGGENLNFAVPINEAKSFIHTSPKLNMQEFRAKVSKAYMLYSLGREAYYSNNINLAIDYLKQAIAIDPGYLDAQIILGQLYMATGMINELIIQSQKIISMDPNNWGVHLDLGIAYTNKGMYDEAIVEFKKAIALSPNDAKSYDNLGVVYARKSMFKEAVAEHQKAIDIDSNYAPAYNNIAVAYLDLSQYDLAIKYCDRAIALGYNVAPGFLKELKPHRKGNPEPVARSITIDYDILPLLTEEDKETLHNLDKETQELHRLAIESYAKKGDVGLAIEYEDKALSRLRKSSKEHKVLFKLLVNLHSQLGRDYLKSGFYNDAIMNFEKTLFLIGNSKDPYLMQEKVDCYHGIGGSYLMKKDIPKTQEYLKKLRAIDTPYANKLADGLEQDIRGINRIYKN